MINEAEDKREDEEILRTIREMQEEEEIKCETFGDQEFSEDVRKAMDEDRARAEEEQSREFTLEFEVQDVNGGPSLHDKPAVLVAYLLLPNGTRVEKGHRLFPTGLAASLYLKEMIEETCKPKGGEPCPS
jgi:hypothetical protein